VRNPQDHILSVLHECEETLRTMATAGRLSSGALGALVELSATIQREMERRQGGDRRMTARSTPDRRAMVPVGSPTVEPAALRP
jgi:hypothetical protein